MYESLSSRTPVARKRHRCVWCGGVIDIGEVYSHEAAVFEGDFQTTKWHCECLEASKGFDWESTDCLIPEWEMKRGTADLKEITEVSS